MNTIQELFNAAVAGLASQGFKRSMSSAELGATCRFRGKDGMKCAVGHLISDEDYATFKERDDAGAYVEYEPSVASIRTFVAAKAIGAECDDFNALASTFLRDLQSAHDGASLGVGSDEPSLMRDNLRRVAAQYELTLPEALAEQVAS